MAQKKMLQWHAAFFAGIQIELEEEAEHLIFENEHMLGTKPMQMDVLIIKKNTTGKIKKNIGQIFKTYNIIEYKSPEDYLSIDDYYKVLGYACFYKADTGTANEIKREEITISFVCNHYPRELIRHLLSERNFSLEKRAPGIYYISGGMFPIQILINKELSEEENLWLRCLTNDIQKTETVEKLAKEYGKNKQKKLYSSVMEIVVQANVDKFSEVNVMCNALMELLKDDIDAIVNEAKLEALNQGLSQGLSQGLNQGSTQVIEAQITKKIAKGKSPEVIADELEETLDTILPIYTRLKESVVTTA